MNNEPKHSEREALITTSPAGEQQQFNQEQGVVMSKYDRRMDINQWCDAEVAILEAMRAVEKMGAHPSLTNAVVMLAKAKDIVSDYVDGEPS